MRTQKPNKKTAAPHKRKRPYALLVSAHGRKGNDADSIVIRTRVRGTLAPVLHEYGVTFRVMHGYGSATALHDVAVESAISEKPSTVLYVGDWDPSGLHVSEVDLPARIARYGGM